MNDSDRNQDREQIKDMISAASQRYAAKGGDVQLASIEGAIVKIAPAGFCWR